MSKFISICKSSKLQLALCPITGLTITLSIPQIPLKVLTYTNPLAIASNAIGIAKLSYKEKSMIPTNILAGASLTLLTHYNLIDDKLSSIERNELLSACSTFQLHTLLYTIASSSKLLIASWPHLSLASYEEEYSKPQHVIANYINIITGKFYISTSVKTETISSTVTKPKKKAIKNVSPALRQIMKDLIIELSPLFNSKIIQILQVISQGNNLYSLNSIIREKIITKLTSIEENESAMKLADIIADAGNSSTEENEVDITQHFTPQSSRSLKDILLEKMNKSRISQEEKRIEEVKKEVKKEEEIMEVEDLFYPSFNRLDCYNCELDHTNCKPLGFCQKLEERRANDLTKTISFIKEIGVEFGMIEEEEEEEEEEDEF